MSVGNAENISPYKSDRNHVDFSGDDIGTLWTHEQHKKNVLRALSAVTPSQHNEIKTETGSQFKELMNLPYYDCMIVLGMSSLSHAQLTTHYSKTSIYKAVAQ